MEDVAIGVAPGGYPDGAPDPASLFRYVERADDLGIDSIWLPDHAISEEPGLDPVALLGAVAARTTDIKMGPSVLTLPARNPVVVANALATLDHLTGGRGRVIGGVGLGADPRLCEAVGIPAAGRADRLREGLEVMRRLWTEDDVDYDGEHYHLEGVSVTPKPAGGALDVWIGGNSEAAMKRVAQYGDGWFPALLPPETFGEKLDRLMDYCADAGREIDRDEAGVVLPTHVDDDPDRARAVLERYAARRDPPRSAAALDDRTAVGSPAACVETIQRYLDAGCTKFVLTPIGPTGERVDQLERYAQDVLPAFGSP